MKTNLGLPGKITLPLLLLLVLTVWWGQHASVTTEQSGPADGAPSLARLGHVLPNGPSNARRSGLAAVSAGAAVGTAGTQRLSNPEAAPKWAVPYGEEFWRSRAHAETAAVPGDTNAAAPFNVGEVVERVSHAFSADDAGTLPEVKAQTYTARFDADAGLGFSPHRPASNEAAVRPQADPDTEAWFRTMAVARDGQAMFTAGQDVPAWSLLGNTAQGLLNEAAGLVAHYEARANAVEVTWVLPQAPAGAGPLVIESELSGLNYAGATEQGLHFADADGVARVRVGPVTVVDAAGGRWNLAMAADGDRLRLEVPADLLAQATYPLAIDPALEAEFEMDKRVSAPSESGQSSPSVAANGNGYLIVWQDRRNGSGDIYGARVTTNGALSDPKGLRMNTAAGQPSNPSVAASGSGYLVVWQDRRNGNGNDDIYGTRVTAAGVVSDPAGLPISTANNRQISPSVAAGGSGFLVVWQDQRNGGDGDIYGTRVAANGLVSDLNGIPISTNAATQYAASVAAGSSGYLVVWQDQRNGQNQIYGARVMTDGLVSDLNGIPISTNAASQSSPSVAASGSGYLVVWEDLRNGNSDIYGTRVATDGLVSELNGLPISMNLASQSLPSVAAGGSGYLVVWEDHRNESADIYGARVTTAGVVSDPDGLPISTNTDDQTSPSVAASSSGFLVVWEDYRHGNGDINGARVTMDGLLPDPNGLPLFTTDNSQYVPSVAAGSNGYLVVWEDSRNGNYDIYGARVTTAGVVSDPNGLPISTANNDEYSPAVAASGSGYLVVWEDYRNESADIYGARVTTAGLVSDPNGLPISTNDASQFYPAVAASSSGFLVVWHDRRDGQDIYGARVATDGVVSDLDGIPISTASGQQSSPAVTASSSGYLVVWHDHRNANFDIYGARVTMAGVVSDPNGLPISTADNHQISPSVAANSSGYLVVWVDYRSGNADIYGARVTTDGVLSETNGLPIATGSGQQSSPLVTAAGDSYVVVWTDGNSLFWHRLNAAGQLLESSPLAINGSNGRYGAAAAYGSAGRFLLTSDSYRNGAQRIIGSLHSTNRPAAGPVLAFKAATFSVLENKAVATITVLLSGKNPGTVSVDYATTDGTATDGDDYEGQSGTLVFPQGTTQQTFTIPLTTNTLHEADETVNLTLSNPTGGATLGLQHRAVLTIKNDDLAGLVSLSAAAYSVRESTHTLTITVNRTGGKASGVGVACTTGGGTAVAGTHYTAQVDTLSFGAGETTKTFTILIADNLIEEGKKTFFVHLLNPGGGAKLGKRTAATVTILEDD